MPRPSRSLLLIAALLALSVRLLVPAGFMPGNAGGRLVLDVCTGHGALKADIGGKPGGRGDSGEASPGCPVPFSNILKVIDNIPIPGASAAVFLLIFAIRPFAASFVHFGARLRPPLRAPPSA